MEFDIIEKYFLPLTQGHPQAAGLKNDTATLSVPAGYSLIVSSDTLNAGIHFPINASAEDIARRALRVNMSDLAASGAVPYAYQLNIAFPETPDEHWLERFSGALLEAQKHFGIFCSGGDTTRINGALSISITAFGLVAEGQDVKRAGARVGDKIVLAGRRIGDAYLGLQCLTGKLKTHDEAYFVNAFYVPDIRFFIPSMPKDIALPHNAVTLKAPCIRAMVDISDGFVADLGHICAASHCGANVQVSEDMFSPQVLAVLEDGKVSIEDLLTGGDDYALLMAVAPEDISHLSDVAVIGEFTDEREGIKIRDLDGQPLSFDKTGWQHF